jgi:hypothetical protein
LNDKLRTVHDEPKKPKTDDILGSPPVDWPWALPHLDSIETIPDPGVDVVGYSAHKDGTGLARTATVRGRTRLVVVGYWHGEYAAMSTQVFLKKDDAEREADADFKRRPIRLRMRAGTIVGINDTIQITGNWPTEWAFNRLYDLGSFCAFLYGGLKTAGRGEEAEALRASLHYAMPGTEAISMFHRALSDGKRKFGQWLSPKACEALDMAITTCADSSRR